MTAQLSWKRALEDSSPVMVNGSAGPAADMHQVDPFQQDLLQDDHPKGLIEEEPAAVCVPPREQSDQKEKGEHDKEDGEEKEEESPNLDEEKQKPDALDDLYTSLASSDIYNSLSVLTKPQENIVRVINTPAPCIYFLLTLCRVIGIRVLMQTSRLNLNLV